MKHLSFIILGCFLFCAPSYAHQDRVIQLRADGTLEGLPNSYTPALLHINFADSPPAGEAIISSIDLTLGKNQVHLPICVTGMLLSKSTNEISLSASWYHDEETLPHYLGIHFFDPGYSKSRWANPGYALLFNLHTGKLMKMEIFIVRDNGKGLQSVAVDLTDTCKPSELKLFSDK